MKLSELTDEQKAAMKVQHYTLHLPAYLTDGQIKFIQDTAKSVINNEPLTIVHEKTMQFLLKIAYFYRSIVQEFDEQDRWTDEDESSLNHIVRGFKPIIEYLQEQYKIDISKFRRD